MNASRMQMAKYLSNNLSENTRAQAVQQVAAWLVANRRQEQVNYIVKDVAQILENRGYLRATITTARPLTESATQRIEDFLRTSEQATELEIETAVDSSLISGVHIQTPSKQLDTTGRGQLEQLVREVSQ